MVWPPTLSSVTCSPTFTCTSSMRWISIGVVEIRRTSAAAEISLADAIEHALPVLGRSGALNVLLAACSLTAYFWQIAHPPQRLIDAFAEEPQVLPDWNLDFASALTQLLDRYLLLSESAERNQT
jgi:hypothetical protein